MLINIKDPRLGTAAIVVRQQTKERLATTCFRNQPFNRAGNFSHWRNVHEVFGNETVVKSLLASAYGTYEENSRTGSVCIDCSSSVGWSGTDDLGKYQPENLHRFEPNRRSWALRVNLGSGERFPAPATTFLTIVYEVREESEKVAIIVHSLYPGKDIGELIGDITGRENCVFFDWEHPGVI